MIELFQYPSFQLMFFCSFATAVVTLGCTIASVISCITNKDKITRYETFTCTLCGRLNTVPVKKEIDKAE